MPVSHDNIRLRAYQIWEQEGRPHGRELEHWAQAEREFGTRDDHGPASEDDAPRDPGIGYSLGTSGEDIDDIRGGNTLEGDVLSDPEPDGSLNPDRRGRTNA